MKPWTAFYGDGQNERAVSRHTHSTYLVVGSSNANIPQFKQNVSANANLKSMFTVIIITMMLITRKTANTLLQSL